jgi:hemerythrin
MSVNWDEDLAIGVEELDDKYRALFWEFYTFSRKLDENKHEETVPSLLAYLETFVSDHFECEEELMRKSSFPSIADHKEEHARFADDLQVLNRQMLDSGASKELALAIKGKLIRWLITHIKRRDIELAAHLKSSPGTSPSGRDSEDLAAMLIEMNIITRLTLERLLERESSNGRKLEVILQDSGLVREKEIIEAKAALLGMLAV